MKITLCVSKRLTSVWLALALATVATAQDNPQDVIDEQSEEVAASSGRGDSRFIGEAGAVFQGSADIDGGGDLSVNRFDAGLLYRAKLGEKTHLTSSYLLGMNDYDFSTTGLGQPWETVYLHRAGAQLSRDLNDHWSVRAGGVLMASLESGADLGDSITGGVTLGADYRVSSNLFLSGGFAVLSQLEDDAEVAPVIAVRWQANDRWLIRFGSIPFSGGIGVGLEGEYKLSDDFHLGLGLLYSQRRFRLDDSGPNPDGVGEENNVPVRVRLGWKLSEQTSLHLIAGVVTGGELRVENSGGVLLRGVDYDTAPYLAVRTLVRF